VPALGISGFAAKSEMQVTIVWVRKQGRSLVLEIIQLGGYDRELLPKFALSRGVGLKVSDTRARIAELAQACVGGVEIAFDIGQRRGLLLELLSLGLERRTFGGEIVFTLFQRLGQRRIPQCVPRGPQLRGDRTPLLLESCYLRIQLGKLACDKALERLAGLEIEACGGEDGTKPVLYLALESLVAIETGLERGQLANELGVALLETRNVGGEDRLFLRFFQLLPVLLEAVTQAGEPVVEPCDLAGKGTLIGKLRLEPLAFLLDGFLISDLRPKLLDLKPCGLGTGDQLVDAFAFGFGCGDCVREALGVIQSREAVTTADEICFKLFVRLRQFRFLKAVAAMFLGDGLGAG
jgi:hypothetical protein